jgi:outer membrane protein OmpA-like peptidoglycan-associated protein
MSALRASIDAVTRAGAARCAPRELALAHANFDFAQMELLQGDALRAQRHLEEVAENVGAAQVLTPERGCAMRAPALDADGSGAAALAQPADADRDSIPDSTDRCPSEVEDGLPPSEADGCKGSDADGDGIADARDACPSQAEDLDGNQDDDGCPETPAVVSGSAEPATPCEPGADAVAPCPGRIYPGVSVTGRELRLATPLVFASDSASLRAPAYASLDVVAQVLADNPTLSLEIAAHTDSRGDDAHNLELSQQQADSVRKYLIARGVDPGRLTARGYGETRPIEANSTSRGRAINRRIELIRTDVSQ